MSCPDTRLRGHMLIPGIRSVTVQCVEGATEWTPGTGPGETIRRAKPDEKMEPRLENPSDHARQPRVAGSNRRYLLRVTFGFPPSRE